MKPPIIPNDRMDATKAMMALGFSIDDIMAVSGRQSPVPPITFTSSDSSFWGEYTMRTSLDALVTAYTGICIFENHMFVPQETDFPDNMFRTLIYTFQAPHALTWIHGYILSCGSIFISSMFFR